MARLRYLILLYAAVAHAQVDCGGVQVQSRALSEAKAMEYCRYAVAERVKVESFWGPTWTQAVRIDVDPSHRISRALIPAFRGNRGLIEMPLRRVADNSGALLHEIVHVYAPHANRFLAEGFAVYLQAKLGGNPSLPNHGAPLARLARRQLPDAETMHRLNAVRTPTPLSSVLDEMSSYLLAGSFVEFLIERHGLEKFRVLYDTGSYESAYGASFEALEREWRANLG